jgi:signal transduction histidine kinase
LPRRTPIYLLLVTLAIVAFFVGSDLYPQRLAARLDQDAVSIATNAAPAIERLTEARGELTRIQFMAAQAPELTAAEAKINNAAMKDAFQDLHEDLAAYLALPLYPHERGHWDAVARSIRKLERQTGKELGMIAAGRTAAARALVASDIGPAAAEADEALEELVDFNADQQNRLGLAIPRLRQRAVRISYVLDGMSAALALLLTGLVLVDYRRRVQLQDRFDARLEGLAAASVRMSEALASAGDLRALFKRIADEARVALDADYAALGCGTDSDAPFSPWAFSGLSPEEARAIGRVPRPVGTLAAVVQHEGPLRADDVTKLPAFRSLPKHHPALQAFLATPVRRPGRNVGTLYLARRPGRPPFTAQDEHVIELFGSHAAVAADNAQLYCALQQERSILQLLADASARIIHSLDAAATLDAVAHALVPSLAELCVLRTVEADQRFGAPVVAAVRPEWADAVRELARRHPQIGELYGPGRVKQSHKSEIIAVTPAQFAEETQVPESLELLRQVPITSLLVVPLIVRDDELLGVCSFASTQESRFGAAERALAEEFARRAPLAMENARRYQQAKAARRARAEVLAIVSHDLRNPLAAIRMTAEVLQGGGSERIGGEQVQRSAGRIKRSADEMLRLVVDLLDAAKIESGSLRAELRPEPIATLVDDALDLFALSARERSIELTSRIDPSLSMVSCDRDRVLQVFSNLIGNALKFTPAGGRVAIRVAPAEGQVRFSVADSGPGIPPEHLPRLFDRYWQSRTARRGGAGLGLYIAKGIVEANGGRMWAESEPGAGAVLSFTLPVCDAAEARQPAR